MTGSTPARLYQERSKVTNSPAVGKCVDVALEVPLAALGLGRLGQRHVARGARVHVFAQRVDRAALAGGVAALEQRSARASPVACMPGLQLDQLDLQPSRACFSYSSTVELLVVGIAARLQRLVLDPVRQLGIVDVELALDAVDLDLQRLLRVPGARPLPARLLSSAHRTFPAFADHAIGWLPDGSSAKFAASDSSRRGRKGLMADTRRDEQARRRQRPRRRPAGAATAGLLAAGIVAVLAVYASPARLRRCRRCGHRASCSLSPRSRRAARAVSARPTGPLPPTGDGLDGLTAQSLAAAVTDPLVIFDAAGIAVHANDAARAAFGVLGPGMSLLLKFRAPEMQALVERMLHAASCRRAVVDYSERVPIERVYRVTASAIGRGTGLFVLVFKDQSETRRIDRMRADFIANASHELRTPLASIAGFVETLRGPARERRRRRAISFLQIMQNQTGAHGAADRRSPVAVAAGDEALSAARRHGRRAPDRSKASSIR